jgi:hypothetical protein
MTSPSYWKPSATKESNKLAAKEAGWKLPGASSEVVTTRTRHGGAAQPTMTTTRNEQSESSDSSYSSESETSSDEKLMAQLADLKPCETRVLLESDPLRRVVELVGRCQVCHGPIHVHLETVCVATYVKISCLNADCKWTHESEKPAGTTVHGQQDDKYERMTDYAANVLLVLACLSCGDGSTEAGRMLGFLGLPNYTTMESRSFHIIEERIGPVIRALADEIMFENLSAEVKAVTDEAGYLTWQQSVDPLIASAPLRKDNYPKLRGSFDQAWQQKKSGHTYDSPSGHGLIFGHYTRKPLVCVVKSKICNTCSHFLKKHPGEEANIPTHTCAKNYSGSSGAMEPVSCLELITTLYDKFECVVELLCCDDDSSIRADCQWSNADYLKNYKTTILPQVPISKGPNKGKLQPRPDKGKLRADIPQTRFVSDPNHRGKLLTGELIALDKATVKEKLTMTRMDSTRIGKNFKYMTKTLRSTPPEEWVTTASAVLDHHFDRHDNCGSWCRRKLETAAERKATKKYYRSVETDKPLFDLLSKLMTRFVSYDKLEDIAHGMDTNCNESFNNTVSWFAPKNKVYCGSMSLNNRIAIAIGVTSLGFLAYFKRLFQKLGIAMTPNVLYFLQQKNEVRVSRLVKLKTHDKKKARNQHKYNKLVEDTKIARKERMVRAGTYRRGMNLDGDEEEEQPPKKKRATPVCPHPFCGLKGHSTTRSKSCKANPAALKLNGQEHACAMAVAVAAEAEKVISGDQVAGDNTRDADDIDAHDATPFPPPVPQEDDDNSCNSRVI